MTKTPTECNDCQNIDLFGSNTSQHEKKPKLTGKGWAILGISGLTFGAFYAVAAPFILPAARRICLPYVPATDTQVKNVMKLLANRSSLSSNLRKQKVIDLGSGDGRIVINAAKLGLTAVGVELNPWLVYYSKWRAWKENVHDRANFQRCNLWKVNLSDYDRVIIFGVEQMMPELEKKLVKELAAHGNVIACRFPLPSWTAQRTIGEGIDTVWLYEKTS